MIYERHVFICVNERQSDAVRPSCGEEIGMAITRAFKKEVKERGLKSKIRAQKAGCFDTCEYGPSVVVYPEGVFYANVQVEDVLEIVESHLIDGKPVDRLVLKKQIRQRLTDSVETALNASNGLIIIAMQQLVDVRASLL